MIFSLKTVKLKHIVSIAISLVLVLAAAYMIFGFSAEIGSDSSKHSAKITGGVIKIKYPDFDKYSDAKQNKVKTTVEVIVRKTAHLTEYVILGALLFIHTLSVKAYKNAKKTGFLKGSGTAPIFKNREGFPKAVKASLFTALAVGVLYASSDEFHQKFVSERAARVTDVLIDSVGVTLGITAVLLVILIINRANRKKVSLD